MKILVTGATGFVGSHLVESLIDDGHQVYSLIRSEKKAKEFKTPGTLIVGDLSTSENSWINQLPSDLEVVIHTAGIVHTFNTQHFKDINTQATKILFDELKHKFQKLNFVFISSLAAAGPGIKTEEDNESPVSLYGESKLKAEKYLKENVPTEWQLNIIRPPMVIGPRDPAVLDIFKMVKDGVVIVTGKNGLNKEYSFVNVFDLVDGIIASAKSQQNGTYFISHPNVITFGGMIKEISSVMKKDKVKNIFVPASLVVGLAHLLAFVNIFYKHGMRLTPDKCNELLPEKWVCRSGNAEKSLKIKSHRNFSITVSETFSDYKSRGWL